MKKTYTKRQIQEAIAYWKGQLAKGNYRKVNESIESEGAREDIEAELSVRGDIPNYLKKLIRDDILEDIGHDGVGYDDWDLDTYVDQLKRDRIVEVDSSTWGQTVTEPIRLDGLKLKFTILDVHEALRKVFPGWKGMRPLALSISIKFPSYGYEFYWSDGCFDDPEYLREISDDGAIPIELNNQGNASSIYDRTTGRVLAIDYEGNVAAR